MSVGARERGTVKREVFRLEVCRACGSNKLLLFLQLGPTPAPNGFLKAHHRHQAEKFYPLDVCFCQDCGLVQLAHVVSPQIMFKNYVYIPSTSETMRNHFAGLALDAIKKTAAKEDDLVIDIGSNDGTLLKSFKAHKMKILGVDPAENLVKKANKEGVNTMCALFTNKLAKEIKKKYGKARIITGTNVVAHVHDLNDFLEGINALLSDEGLFICEFPYLIGLLEGIEFDTIYQEHLSYFSISPFNRLLKRHGLTLIDVQRLPVHGGSVRVFVSKKSLPQSMRVKNLLKLEEKKKILKQETYLKFRKKVDKVRHELVQLLWTLRIKNKSIVGYGASAKGNIILNYCRIGPETLDYIVDSISYKQGKFTPGMHIPIFPESKLLEDQPDYTLLLAWNFADEIIKKQSEYRKRGGKFILALPKLTIV
ncbi:MAG: class I SAM-dependent methyltransferase [Candidatus Daviesbacteria bacterium]|nr:class I SAM-dependent methyltransferase [Candidatus Daviesbacteria bacterium]